LNTKGTNGVALLYVTLFSPKNRTQNLESCFFASTKRVVSLHQRSKSPVSARTLIAMSSTPSGGSFKDHLVASLPSFLNGLLGSSAEAVPTEGDIDRLKKEVDDFYANTRKQASRYQRDLETLVCKHGTADQARRRDIQKSAKQEEG
jgi:hypothetical protein